MKPYYILAFLFIILISGCSREAITGNVVKEPIANESLNEENLTTADELSEIEEGYAEEILKKQEEQRAKLERTPENAVIVEIKDLQFVPEEVAIRKGMTVIWEHNDRYLGRENIYHKVTAHYNEFVSPMMKFGDNYNHTFTKEGAYTYVDSVYKRKMRGEIRVVE